MAILHGFYNELYKFKIAIDLQEGSDALSLTLGVAAATGLGLLAFSEVGLIMLRELVSLNFPFFLFDLTFCVTLFLSWAIASYEFALFF